MKHKVIVGISSFAGSNTTYILKKLQDNLQDKSRKILKIYSLKNETVGEIANKIELDDDECAIHVIKNIRTLAELHLLSQTFQENHLFDAIGIQVPWTECFRNFQDTGRISKDVSKAAWRARDLDDPYRENIMKCFNEIGTDKIYRCQDGDLFQEIGRLSDFFLLLGYEEQINPHSE